MSSCDWLCGRKAKRLTREQRKDQTRERLIVAARTMFIKKGYADTSVEDVAVAAGYTRGAFYSNFGTKAELLIEVLRREHDSTCALFQSIMNESNAHTETEARAPACWSALVRDDDCFPVWVEAALLASRDPTFHAQFNALRNERRDQIAVYIRALSAHLSTGLPMPAETLALGLASLCDGVQVARMCNPQQVTGNVAEAVFARFFWGAIAR